jgi:AcrR family transcriptional regulator
MTTLEIDSVNRIRESALAEIQKTGILGLRLADVAAGAGVSVPLIYKYYTDRDGLLAAVLGEVIEQHFDDELNGIRLMLQKIESPSNLEQILPLVPLPDDAWRRERRWLRLEAKAAAREIPALRERMVSALSQVECTTTDLILKARKLSGNTSPVSARTVAWMLLSFSDGFTNSDLNEQPITDDEYLPLIRSLLSTYVF